MMTDNKDLDRDVMTSTITIHKWIAGKLEEVNDCVVQEGPLEIRLSYVIEGKRLIKPVAVTMRTPGQDALLARGFLLTEGLIDDLHMIDSITTVAENVLLVRLHEEAMLDPTLLNRNFYTSSSCGVCGKASIEAVFSDSKFLPWSSRWQIDALRIEQIRLTFGEHKSLFALTGGNHAVGIYDRLGKLLTWQEDVGRHNAMDKVIGAVPSLPLDEHITVLSGRASFELIQKAAKAGIAIVMALGAPSSLAIDLASEHGMTLIGFLKKDHFNIYCGNHRIQLT